MADALIYAGDVGTEFSIEVGTTDVGSASTQRIYWVAPSGAKKNVEADTYSDTLGTIIWNVDADFFDEVGQWTGQAYLYYGAGQAWYGDPFTLEVKEIFA